MSATWQCDDCALVIEEGEFDEAVHPFRMNETVIGCPNCGNCEGFTERCQVDGCTREATSGTPTDNGYVRCCGEHFRGFQS